MLREHIEPSCCPLSSLSPAIERIESKADWHGNKHARCCHEQDARLSPHAVEASAEKEQEESKQRERREKPAKTSDAAIHAVSLIRRPEHRRDVAS